MQLLVLSLDNALYGVDIMQVREIKAFSPLTQLPGSVAHLLGVMNLRGVIVPVHDLRLCFEQQAIAHTQKHVVVMLQLQERLTGLVVDAVYDIVDCQPEDICPIPDAEQTHQQDVQQGVASNQPAHYRRALAGMLNHEDRMITILKPDYLFDASVQPVDVMTPTAAVHAA